MTDRLRVLVVGAGGMGRAWLRVLDADAPAELVGLVDLDLVRAEAALADHAGGPVPVSTDLVDLVRRTGAEAVINVTVPEAHHHVNTLALNLGLPVLCEKPAAPDVATALRSAAVAARSGHLLMISQSRRYFAEYARLCDLTAGLGALGLVSVQHFRAARFDGGFREQMPHALLVDMAIHPFDAVRHLVGATPVSVMCDEWNPAYSWYADGSTAAAVFEFASGLRFAYTASWVAAGYETGWNGHWRVVGEGGTVLWDGETAPVRHLAGRTDPDPVQPIAPAPREIAGSLREFVGAVRTGTTPWGCIDDNVLSLAMVEAAVRSAETRSRVTIADVLDAARTKALSDEPDPDLRARLKRSGS
jgi:predicted dehydrogenase